MENKKPLHIVMFPWLATGHLIPFFHLSKLIAQKGHKISFISTPKNLLRLPKTPPHLISQITLISFPLPPIQNLPPHAESSTDIPYHKQQLLKAAFDLLKLPLTTYLQESTPPVDWVIYDYASHWLPSVAAQLGISRAFFSLFNAAGLSFIGPPSELVNGDPRSTAEDFTVVPKWIPLEFESNVVYRLHEVSKYAERGKEEASDSVRYGVTVQESEVVFIRSCVEFEPDWFGLLIELYKKPVVSVGFLPPVILAEENEEREIDVSIKRWLDKQQVNSVVYVALGTEVTLSREELSEMALGLEKSGLPFFWVLRKPTESTQNQFELLPDGFEERVKGRGIVYFGWAPQVEILSHESVGGFLTHCGWNSVVEGLGFGRVLIMFPALNDQGLNARLLHGKKLGLEIPRNERDGSFTCDSVAESLRLAMVDDSGEMLRVNAKEMGGLVGDREKNANYVDEVVHLLEEGRTSRFRA